MTFWSILILSNETFRRIVYQNNIKKIDEAEGGVLLIDEAYSLGNPEKRDSFSKECIDTLNQNLTDKLMPEIEYVFEFTNKKLKEETHRLVFVFTKKPIKFISFKNFLNTVHFTAESKLRFKFIINYFNINNMV